MDEQTTANPTDRQDAAPQGRAVEATPAAAPEGWREMKAGDLRTLCQQLGIAHNGGRAKLLKRLETLYLGSSTKHANARVVCPYCKAPARCNGTRWMSDTILRRSYRCDGRRRHTFTLDSEEKAK